jgi:hypothetical protein
MPEDSIIGSVFGSVHRWWMSKTTYAALVAFVFYLAIVFAARTLHIWSDFSYKVTQECIAIPATVPLAAQGTPGGQQAPAEPALAYGFEAWNWGFLYSFALPLAVAVMGLYFRALDRALLSLDDVIKPQKAATRDAGTETKQDSREEQTKRFTLFLTDRIRVLWPSVVFPVSLALSLLLTVVADGHDIVAPLQARLIWPTCTRDWSTVGFTTPNAAGQGWYFVFNCAAFLMQAFLGYCGILVLTLTGTVFGQVFTYGLGRRDIIETFRQPGSPQSPVRYAPEWIWCFERCGLEKLDNVFLAFTGLSFFALVASATSIFVNVYGRHHVTHGSVILAIGTMFFIPWSAFWVFIPYFTNFPRDFPPNFVPTRTPCVKPNPWPFGGEKMTWVLIAITSGFWVTLFLSLIKGLFGN